MNRFDKARKATIALLIRDYEYYRLNRPITLWEVDYYQRVKGIVRYPPSCKSQWQKDLDYDNPIPISIFPNSNREHDYSGLFDFTG